MVLLKEIDPEGVEQRRQRRLRRRIYHSKVKWKMLYMSIIQN